MPKNLLLSVFAALLCGAAGAADVFANAPEYFVNADPEIGSDSYDGTTATPVSGTLHGPKLTIQAAVNLITHDKGAIVTLAPGVYDKGEKLANTKNLTSNRVVITHQNVKLRGTAGHRDDTIILGKKDWAADSTHTHGLGPAAVRCIFGPGGDTDQSVIVEGLTIANGTTRADDPKSGNSERGGGARGVTLVDCVVSNSAAIRGGGLYQCTAFRCRFIDNYAGSAGGAAGCRASYSNCFITRNWGSAILAYVFGLVNCTITDNQTDQNFIQQSNTLSIYNTLIINNEKNGNYTINTSTGAITAYSYAYACVAYRGFFKTADAQSVTNEINRYGELVSPALGDVRILTTANSYNRGLGEYVDNPSILPFPDGYEPQDIDGNPIPTSGAIHVGCSQEAVVPAGAAFAFRQACEIVGTGKSLGDQPHRFTDVYQYLRPTVTGEVYRLKPILADGVARRYAIYDNSLGSDVSSVYAMYDGTYCFPTRPIRADDAPVQLRPITCDHIYYADAENGDDSYDGTSPTHVSGTVGPKKTIKAAAALHTDGQEHTVVYVAPGTYEEESGTAQAAVAFLKDNLMIVSTVKGGATIVGRRDSSTATGLGSGALRCVYMSKYEGVLQGFVLSGGYGLSTSTAQTYAGAGVYCTNTRNCILDCTVRGCVAATAPAQTRGRALRTAFYDNTALSGSLLWLVSCYSCVFAGNTYDNYAFYDRSNAFFCSIAAGGRKLADSSSAIFVGVVAEGVTEKGSPSGAEVGVNIDGCFAAPDDHDFRLGALSPAYGAVPAEEIWDLSGYVLVTTDFNGDDLQLEDGSFTAGAVHNRTPLPCVAVNVPATAAKTVVTGGHAGTNVLLTAACEIDVTVDPDRPYLCIRKDGEEVSTAKTYHISVSGLSEGSIVYDVVYGTDWYVDQKNGDDSNTGATLALAKKRLTTAAGLAISGDTVRVAPGTYGDEDGTMLQSPAFTDGATATLPCRLWVKKGVTVESLEGHEKTYILGRKTAGSEHYGMGDDSVRCVALSAQATIRGFTIAGGSSRYLAERSYADDYNSAGVFADGGWTSSIVEDCVVSNNCSVTCGAGVSCRFVRSILVDNRATQRAACTRSCALVGCLIDRNIGINTIEHFGEFDSCTLGAYNRSKMDGTGYPATLIYSYAPVKNSIILQKSNVSNGSMGNKPSATNTVFIQSSGPTAANWTLDDRSQFLDWETAMSFVDESYRPLLVEESPYLDKVDATSEAASDAAAVGTHDATGYQRRMNGYRDIGALEADWREIYARAISTSPRLTVKSASPDVVQVPSFTGEVRIPDGATLCPTWKVGQIGTRYRITVAVLGSGTLTVSRDGEVIDTVRREDGDKEVLVTAVALNDTISLAYAGTDGYAVVRGTANAYGFIMIMK